MVGYLEKANHGLPYGGWLILVLKKKQIKLSTEFLKMPTFSNQMLGQHLNDLCCWCVEDEKRERNWWQNHC